MENTMNIHEATLVYLRRDDQVCLAPKKKDIHAKGESTKEGFGLFFGYGGKLDGMTPRKAAVTELLDESGASAKEEDLIPAAIINFIWIATGFVMKVYIYFLDKWEGDPMESEEMGAPQFFKFSHPSKVPYSEMMPNDIHFFPRILAGEKLVGEILIGPKDANGRREIKPNLRNDPEALKHI